MYRATLLLCVFFIIGKTAYTVPDTLIYLDAVEIHENRFEAFSVGSKTQTFDSTDISIYKGASLSMLLKARSSMFIKGYGPGMLATPSLRGGSSSQTALLWNGFNIQSPMHGQNDLALFPLIFTDRIQIQHGSAGAIYGSGAVGSAINMSNSIDFNGMLHAETEMQASNTENFIQAVQVKTAGTNFAGTIRFFNQNNNNRFRYSNPYIADQPVSTRQYAETAQYGIMNEVYYRNNNNLASVRLWYHKSDRNIPPSLMQSHSGAFQNDESLRITANWQKLFTRSMVNFRAAYFDETILFRDSLGIESLSNSGTWIQELQYRMLEINGHSIDLGAGNQFISAQSEHYSNKLSINRLSAFSTWKWVNKADNFSLFASLRQEWQENIDIPFIPAFGFAFQLSSNLALKGNAGKNFRIPSLNDLYWVPGGNSELLPESGWNQDLMIEYRNSTADENPVITVSELSLTGFHRNIVNWIIWLPEGGIWTPQNVMQVRSAGLEATSAIEAKLDRSAIQLRLFYDYVSAKNEKQKSPNDESVGKQLIYVPKHSAGAILSASFGKAGFYYEHNYSGKRYISSDNLYSLDPFNTGNLGVSYLFSLSQALLTISFDIHNIWNESYVITANNPMPLRYFQLRLNLKWNRKMI